MNNNEPMTNEPNPEELDRLTKAMDKMLAGVKFDPLPKDSGMQEPRLVWCDGRWMTLDEFSVYLAEEKKQ